MVQTAEDGGGFLHGGCRLRRTAEVFCMVDAD